MHQQQQALQESEARFRGMFDNISSGVAIYEAVDDASDFVFVDFNPAGERMDQIARADVVGRRVTEVFPGVEQFGLLDVFRRVWQTGETMHHPVTLYEDSRLAGWRENHVFRLPSREIVAIYEDITPRKQAEEMLQASEEKFRLMFQTCPLGMVLCEMDGSFVQANQAYLDIIGYTHEEAVELSYWDVTPHDYDADEAEQLRSMEATGRYGPYEKEYAHKTGERVPVLLNGMVVKGPDGVDRIWSIVEDITERKRAEAALREYHEKLEARVQERTAELQTANKDLEDFAYSVSHDLKAPLRAITGFSEIISRRYREDLNDEGRRYFDHILAAAGTMDRLIEDLLRYSRLGRQSLEVRPVPLAEVFGELYATYRSRVQELGGRLDLPDAPPAARADATLLTQIFGNLVDNALTYRRPDVPPVVEIRCRVEGDRVIVSVTDSGIGIPTEFHEKVFQVFQRLHSDAEVPGTGIGLALVRKAATMLGSRVWLESVPGRGSTFHVELQLDS